MEETLAQGFVSRHEASAVVMNLRRLLDAAGPNDSAVTALRTHFDAAVRAAGFDDLASTQAAYAMRLAESSGELSYEEMHKLFSLTAELDALQRLGYSPTPAAKDALQVAVRARFAAQRRLARMVAADRVEDWSRGLWWFAENEAP
jgi:hypothetical protein